MARLALEIEREVGVTVSVGLSHNKYLAKTASDLDKPRGFAVIGRVETAGFLAQRSVRTIWGVGKAMADRLEADGFMTNADLRKADARSLVARYGAIGQRLHDLAGGIDHRHVDPEQPAKSISSETTFDDDIADSDRLVGDLWRLAVSTSNRAKSRETAGKAVVLKLRTREFRTLTRQCRLAEPSNLAEVIYRATEPMLLSEIGRGPFRLIGVGIGALSPTEVGDPPPRLFTDPTDSHALAEAATDRIRGRYGQQAIIRGRA